MAHGHEAAHGAHEAHGVRGNVPGVDMPDWKTWKVEGTPLEVVQQRLAKRGLRDPWLRNEAWRYSGSFANPPTFWKVVFKGFKYGFAAFAVALAVEYTVFPPNKGGHH
ncbi:NADH dehydrogenase [ubiquinone] 1 beta subcomplex subunit 3 [Lethenteron reissneri]|uniref:NADH dehydrogenase [ubiquinone] 1 beta subcomplex subunit 3 n=1 Tax=Lethenteron reissneri TaxID=7753 RepID=UPI002AB63201|nr:NADH dehydrogenase [ubiquinone] 1 beta subcomplex subunit 3 [Lethenteron reissneri]